MPADYVIIDFETQSACEIKTAGAERYAEDPTTSVLCLALAWPTGPVELWKAGDVPPPALIEHVRAGRLVVAHNTSFELAVWNTTLRRDPRWPELQIEQCDDTMARARAMSLPGGLDDCAHAVRLPVSKDKEGHRVMLKLARPRKREPLEFWTPETAPEDFAKLYAYCVTDVEVERELHKLLPPLSRAEHALWHLDQRINSRGVQLDMANVQRALALIAEEKQELSAKVFALTGGKSTATQRDALLEWLQGEGVEVAGLTKADVAKLLKDDAMLASKPAVKAVLELRKQAAKGSTAKLTAMVASACKDNRARGLVQYHGASTGRWAGRRIQTQNMPRTGKGFKLTDAEATIHYLRYPSAGRCIRREYGSVMEAVSWSLRSFIHARPGHRLVTADYSNIEGRVLAWLAGEQWKVEAFREFDAGRGADLYKLAYAKSFGVPVESVDDDGQRQIGKVQELALGYQGGIGSYISMGANYGVVPADIAAAVKAVTPAEVWDATMKRLPKLGTKFRAGLEPDVWCGLRIVVDGWRAAHPRVVQFWAALQDAAIEAVEYPGTVTSAGGMIRYLKDGDFLKCKLPSGRCVVYPYAAMKKFPSMRWEAKRDELKYNTANSTDDAERAALVKELMIHEANIEWEASLTYWGVSSKAGSSKKWKQQRAYGGLLSENVTQATARDCLAEAIPRLESAGYPVVMHVHDEIVCEVPNGYGSLNELAHKMCAGDKWTAGLPITAAGWQGERYRKG